jgi:hypothetical protein
MRQATDGAVLSQVLSEAGPPWTGTVVLLPYLNPLGDQSLLVVQASVADASSAGSFVLPRVVSDAGGFQQGAPGRTFHVQ